MRVYSHLPGYLLRWRLLGAGRFMLRLHRILSPDGTPFLHTHPFWYVSVVLRGGYTERFLRPDGTLAKRRHGPGAVIVRRPDTAHRIDSVRLLGGSISIKSAPGKGTRIEVSCPCVVYGGNK